MESVEGPALELDDRAGVVARAVHRDAGLARDVFEAVEDPELEGDRCGPGPVAGHQRECKQDASPHGRHLSRAGTNQRPDAIVDADMDVYLLPVGQDRYELYCEVPDEPEAPPETEPPKGMLQRLRRRFADMLAEAERERRHGQSAHRSAVDRGWIARSKARMMRWVAESIGEQRLLWHMRRQTEACLFFPDDVTEVSATARLRAQLARDRDRHRFWLSIDSVGFVLSGLLMLLPGPNLVAYYFAFRLVGHYLSMMGARRGLEVVRWRTEGSPPLSECMKSYGRAPTFLMLTGYEQVRSIAADAGDHEAAARVELVLPETGVCSRSLAPDASNCCGGPHYRMLTLVASRMKKQNSKEERDAAAVLNHRE